MSMEAQFYEARRRQSFIERRQSLQTEKEIERQSQQSEYQLLYIPMRIFRQNNKHGRCTCVPIQRNKLTKSDQSLFQRDRDIYPRLLPLATNTRRHIRRPKLLNRFSSIEYLQQW